jgi:hypothetical protein
LRGLQVQPAPEALAALQFNPVEHCCKAKPSGVNSQQL